MFKLISRGELQYLVDTLQAIRGGDRTLDIAEDVDQCLMILEGIGNHPKSVTLTSELIPEDGEGC